MDDELLPKIMPRFGIQYLAMASETENDASLKGFEVVREVPPAEVEILWQTCRILTQYFIDMRMILALE